MKKLLFLDIETTGFSADWNEIIEVAGIVMEGDKEIDRFHEYIRPKKGIPAKITEITGIKMVDVSNADGEKEVLRRFVEWCYIQNPDALVGQNIKSFDLRFIKTKANKYNLPWKEFEIIDTLPMARSLIKQDKIRTANAQQKTLAEFFNIEYQAHSAIEDVRALIIIYKKMNKLIDKKPSLGF